MQIIRSKLKDIQVSGVDQYGDVITETMVWVDRSLVRKFLDWIKLSRR